MKGIYQEWIDQNYPDSESARDRCNKAVREMAERFPELTIQAGWANGAFHCWLKDAAGDIVDPTAKQFDGDIEYQLIADRFLDKKEIEGATGIVFLKNGQVHIRAK